MVFESIKRMMGRGDEDVSPEFIEIDLEHDKADSKVLVKTFSLKVYEDVTPILNVLREGYTIAVIDIKEMKSKDVVELKRAISKIKKTIDALDGSIAGFGENVVIATPSFAKIEKGAVSEERQRVNEIERF